jgi:hypothetical protein
MRNILDKDTFNFGFNSIMHYIEQVEGLKEKFDLITPLEENKVHNGGLLIKAFNILVQATMQKLGHGFDVGITDPFGNIVLIFMHDGEELQEFFNNMLVNIELE